MPAYGSPALRDFERDNPNAYSVSVQFTIPARNSRFWAFPLLGYVLKQIVLIPHVIVLFFVGVLVMLSQLVLWVPVLLLGRYPKWGYTLVGGYIRWTARIQAFSFGLTDQYPPFRLKD
ncbi:MAG: DUF4389 domain-containing protein [Dehalococcoidia bacterium]|nr:DUF4389 domain-containing protein [Dehalococcoidia bacterium]